MRNIVGRPEVTVSKRNSLTEPVTLSALPRLRMRNIVGRPEVTGSKRIVVTGSKRIVVTGSKRIVVTLS